jgi:rhodanese-related sulfurtransferase
MDRRYTILAILAIVLAAGLLFIPNRGEKKEITPEKLLAAINDPARFLSTDAVTERIIGGDPTLQLIDVRPEKQFNTFALPGAVNIPVDSILSPSWTELLHQHGKDKVFYSNGDVEADAAWQICARKGIHGVFVMKGGLNHWYNTIIKGAEPLNTASSDDLDLYSFRLSARQYFTGGGNQSVASPAENAKKPVKVMIERKPVKKSSGGGC